MREWLRRWLGIEAADDRLTRLRQLWELRWEGRTDHAIPLPNLDWYVPNGTVIKPEMLTPREDRSIGYPKPEIVPPPSRAGRVETIQLQHIDEAEAHRELDTLEERIETLIDTEAAFRRLKGEN